MTEQNVESDENDGGDEDNFTTKTNVRVKYLGSFIALLIIGGFLGLVYLVALGHASTENLTTLGLGGAFITLVLAAGTWTFGIDLLDKWNGNK